MSHKPTTHLKGDRGQAFTDRIRNIPPERILCVSLDIGKYFHVVMIHNALGEIVTPTFEIDIFQSGFTALCAAIDEQSLSQIARCALEFRPPLRSRRRDRWGSSGEPA